MQKNKVSVVVPIYKVEKYICRCINSIINQTYANLEIILVNDGSPDNSGRIADSYQENNPKRIKVIHKENGGLSDARNIGMELATGEYIMFVDSDDWLDTTMIETMMNIILEFDADVVQSAFYYAYQEKLLMDNRKRNTSFYLNLYDNKSLMHELVLNEKVKNFAWGKLYKTEMVRHVPFEKGVLFEDVFWAHQVMYKVKRFVSLNKPMYYYFQRDDSIVANYSTKNLDMIKGLKKRHRFIAEFYPDLINESFKMILKSSLIHYNLLLLNRIQDPSGIHRKEIQQYIQNHYQSLIEAAREDKQLRNQLKLFSVHPQLNVLFLGVRKLLRKTKLVEEPEGLEQV
ncbi:glycosyltransferase family 2 protein [Virgibacillus flavescens]|uniref:glycosyltransferase family 2 protein n=1 Tax=Virgibacillus flavescens TaxID=1611422 RepID=UPI003D34F8C0